MSRHQEIYELKDKAKWLDDRQERKNAVKQLVNYGDEAIPALEEIFEVTVSSELRVACVDAINAIKEKTSPKEELTNPERATQTNAL